MNFRRTISLLALLCLAFLIAACGEIPTGSAAIREGSYEVAPLFRDFYADLGGMDTLGPAISPLFTYGDVSYQYTVAGLMGNDPQAPANQRFYLAALGLDMGIIEPGVSPPDRPGVRYVGGHILYEAFIPWYEKLGGAAIVGLPITELHYNPLKGRYEQFFENLGFFSLETDNPEKVRLLPYGQWKCADRCSYTPGPESLLDVPYPAGQEFANAVSRLGPDFTGVALSEVRTNTDGFTEQVFGNVVLVIDPELPGKVLLLPIAERLGIEPEDQVFQSKDPDMIFIPIQGNKGYNMPRSFMDYLALHGGVDISGPPVTGLTLLGDGVYRQCFTNLCLEERRNDRGALRIRPVPLGYDYLERGTLSVSPNVAQLESQSIQPESPSATAQLAGESLEDQTREFSVDVWERHPTVAQDQSQEITVSVFKNNVPVSLVEPLLVLTLPEDKDIKYYMLPTEDDGTSYLKLDPINIQNGTLIPYQVCVYGLGSEEICVEDSFMIWGEP